MIDLADLLLVFFSSAGSRIASELVIFDGNPVVLVVSQMKTFPKRLEYQKYYEKEE